MASGKVHAFYYDKGWYFIYATSVPISVGMGLITNSILFGVLFFIFYIVNYWKAGYITPDADHILLTDPEWKLIADGKKRFWWIGGFIATCIVAWWILYGYISGKHRSWYSHGWLIGTIGRMIHHNIPIFYFFVGISNWNFYLAYSTYQMQYWVYPYLLSQFVSWFMADAFHLILDTEYAKGRLYDTKKRKRK